MTNTAQKLIDRLKALPEEEQERTAQFMLDDLDELERLRDQLKPAIEQFDRGEGVSFSGAVSFIERMKQKHGLA